VPVLVSTGIVYVFGAFVILQIVNVFVVLNSCAFTSCCSDTLKVYTVVVMEVQRESSTEDHWDLVIFTVAVNGSG